MMVKRSMLSGTMVMPSQEPADRISRMLAIAVRVRVKPMPMPTPSSAESSTVFLQANISARPSTMQFTTIRGRYTPRAVYKLGEYACTTICTSVTKVAIMAM